MALTDIIKLITLDIYNHDTTPETIKSIAADNDTRYVAAEIQNEGIWYDIGQSSTVVLTVLRPDNVGVSITGQPYPIEYQTGGEVDPDTGDETPVVTETYYGVYAELDQPALAKAGTLLGQFKITSGDQILRTEIFKINNGRALDTETSEWAGEYDGHNLDEMAAEIEDNTADIDSIESDVSQIKEDLNDLAEQLYTDGDAVEIQKADATSFVMNSPSGLIHVKATATPIITGTANFIDLFDLAQGVFTDSNSGVTIEITGNEVYVHGSPTKGFRFDFQNGVFFTDAFTNHASDFGDILSNVDSYSLVWYEKAGYTLPSNVYIAALKQNGTINPGGLNTHVKAVYPKVSNQYIAMYTNGAVSNLDIKFTLGMKFHSFPIEATAQTEYNTTVIRDNGYYETKALTWTLADNVYDVVKATSITAEDPLTKGHIYAWFGDSLSQLKELPNIVSDLLNVKVYDCTFAGAPLTYGDPTKYQPTGFMSLTSQIVAHDFTPLSDAIDAQEQAGTVVTEKRQHLATLRSLDFNEVTDIVLLAGTNDFDNDYVNATKFVNGFSDALTALLTAYPHLMVYVISPPWRGDKTEGVTTIPTMEDIVRLEKEVADTFCLPFYDLYHRSGINALTASVYLTNDLLHPSDAGDSLLANKCAKFIQSN